MQKSVSTLRSQNKVSYKIDLNVQFQLIEHEFSEIEVDQDKKQVS